MGQPPPARIPGWALQAAAQWAQAASLLRRREPSLTPELASIWSTSFSINDARARRELGHASRPFEETVDDTFRWYRSGLAESRDALP